jgi:hypothetical protein
MQAPCAKGARKFLQLAQQDILVTISLKKVNYNYNNDYVIEFRDRVIKLE